MPNIHLGPSRCCLWLPLQGTSCCCLWLPLQGTGCCRLWLPLQGPVLGCLWLPHLQAIRLPGLQPGTCWRLPRLQAVWLPCPEDRGRLPGLYGPGWKRLPRLCQGEDHLNQNLKGQKIRIRYFQNFHSKTVLKYCLLFTVRLGQS